jgi:hypothetical protein
VEGCRAAAGWSPLSAARKRNHPGILLRTMPHLHRRGMMRIALSGEN